MWDSSWNGSIELWSWQSSNHHADGDVIVIIWILGLVSIFIKNRFEGIITDNLSEGFESNRLDIILSEGWGDLDSDGLNLIDCPARKSVE